MLSPCFSTAVLHLQTALSCLELYGSRRHADVVQCGFYGVRSTKGSRTEATALQGRSGHFSPISPATGTSPPSQPLGFRPHLHPVGRPTASSATESTCRHATKTHSTAQRLLQCAVKGAAQCAEWLAARPDTFGVEEFHEEPIPSISLCPSPSPSLARYVLGAIRYDHRSVGWGTLVFESSTAVA